MKEEILRINRMVAEGKISPEDAAELIALIAARPQNPPPPPTGETPPPPPPTSPNDPFRAIAENFGRVKARIEKEFEDAGVKEKLEKGFGQVKEGFGDLTKMGDRVPWFGGTEVRQSSLDFKLPEGKRLVVLNNAGPIDVKVSSERTHVHSLAKAKGLAMDEAKARVDAQTLVIEESETTVTIRQADIPGISVGLTIHVPEGRDLELRGMTDHVHATGAHRSVKASTRAGDLAIDGVRGDVEAITSSGNVAVKNVGAGQVTVESKTGQVNLQDVDGSINVKSDSGNVLLMDCGGRVVSIETVDAQVKANLVDVPMTTLNVRTVSGGIDVGLPVRSDASVNLSSLRGRIDAEIELDERLDREGRVTGRLGSGLGTFDLSSITGPVKLGTYERHD